jgi:hypothetical protein
MTAPNNENFRWNSLIGRIKRKKVIPVIGQGLYRVETQSGGKKDFLLYDYLSERILESCGATLQTEENHKFAKACFEFLKNNRNDYLELSDFLKETLEGIQLVQDNSLRKLARIKGFNVFINTTYDKFLENTITTTRNITTTVRYYSISDKESGLVDDDLLSSINNLQCTLVYHILGTITNEDCIEPSYTERDILETIVEFQKDMVNSKNQNALFQKLKSSSLLFLGCGYDDWLFRFFIRTVTNQPYESLKKDQTCNFVEDNFLNNKRDPFRELPRFLNNYETEVFYSSAGTDFVDMLFKEVEENYPDGIISSSEVIAPLKSPVIAFISFEGNDRLLARKLAKNLGKDGIGVWLDEREFKGGDDVDKKILNAIDQCPAFIPLISKNSQQIQTDDGKLKYHIQEWQHAYSNKINGKADIIPVIIDDTKWKYDKFKTIYHLQVEGGNRVGDYKKLRDQLKEILKKIGINNERKER